MPETIKTQREQLAQALLENPEALEEVVSRLKGSSRRARQNAASTLSVVASLDPAALLPYCDAVVAALERPEAQTRWECLDILSALTSLDAAACGAGLAGAEGALFDEDSGPLRLAALRFLCRFGATSSDRSVEVWPLIDEAIQCYHGDPEFQDMLIAIVGFAESGVDAGVADALKGRMEFDARNGKGMLKKRASHIIAKLDGE